MDPQPLKASDWLEINRLLLYLVLFGGLGLTAALSFLVSHAVIPSLVESRDAPRLLGSVRWLAYPIAAMGLILGLYAFARVAMLAADVMGRVYPRFWM
jgi:hypothetical protein